LQAIKLYFIIAYVVTMKGKAPEMMRDRQPNYYGPRKTFIRIEPLQCKSIEKMRGSAVVTAAHPNLISCTPLGGQIEVRGHLKMANSPF